MPPRPEDEVPLTSGVAPGAITALLRDVFRAAPVADREAMPEFRPGQAIGRFELVRELGRGGFGVVFEAADRQLRRSVAVKAVRMGGDVELKEERLLREAEAAAQLSHPNIVTLFDVGTFDRGPYLVMELLRGGTLAERLRQGPLGPEEALRIATEVASAVAHAHANGVIHRDLTPRNVFLCDDGHAKVLDFGMAQAFGHHRVHGGTVAYMAPEQFRGEPEDARTDVFALGAIVHEMLTGTVPFGDPAALASAAPAPALDVPALPGLGPLVARMLAKDPAQRPGDGAEVLAALAACHARSARGRGARRRRLALGAALALVAAAAVVTGRVRSKQDGGGAAPRDAAPGAVAAPAPAPASPEPSAAARPPAPDVPAGPPAPARQPERAQPAPRRAERKATPVRVRFCRAGIDTVPPPEVESGDGVLGVEAEPYGEVFVAGRAHGETPVECQVAAGAYVVRVLHPLLGARERRIVVRPGERAAWVAEFGPPP